MRKNGWKRKMLAGILCASLVFQSVSVTAFAEESTQEVQTEEVADNTATETEETEASKQPETEQKETEQKETEQASETQAQEKQTESTSESSSAAEESTATAESSTEAVSEETTKAEMETATEEETESESEIATGDEAQLGEGEEHSFQNVEIKFNTFVATISSGSFTKHEEDNNVKVFLVQYQCDEKISSTELSVTDNGSSLVWDTCDIPLYWNTDKVQLKASGYCRAPGIFDDIDTSLAVLERTNYPDVSFSVKNVKVNAGSISLDLSYTGDLEIEKDSSKQIYVDLCYDTDQYVSSSGLFSNNENDSQTTKNILFQGIPSNQTFQAKLKVYSMIGSICMYEQIIDLGEITTKQDSLYELEEAFPDEVFRLKVKSAAGVTGTTVMQSELEKITQISNSRYDFSTSPVKNLTGIDLLTNIETVHLENNEIEDISAISWEKLTKLDWLNLQGNEISQIPDFSKNAKLMDLFLSENRLPQSELQNIASKLPKGIEHYEINNQRVNGFGILAEEEYYKYGDKSPVIVELNGYKSRLGYTFKFYIDDNETAFSKRFTTMYQNTEINLAPGEHTLKVELIAGDAVEASKVISFNIVQKDYFTDPIYHYADPDNTYYYARVYFPYQEGIQVAKAEMIDSDGNVVATQETPSLSTDNYGLKYKTLGVSINFGSPILYSCWMTFEPLRNSLAAGAYSIKLTFTDATSIVYDDAIEIKTKAFISLMSAGSSCDNSSDYFYLYLRGEGIKPDRLNYSFEYEGITLTSDYVSSKKTSDGVIVKLKKNGWMAFPTRSVVSVRVYVTPEDGYDITIDADNEIPFNQAVFYTAYNQVTEKLEVGLSVILQKDDASQEVKAELTEMGSSSAPVLATGTAYINDDGFMEFDMRREDGTVWKPETSKGYIVYCTYGGKTYRSTDWSYATITSPSPRTDYWSLNSQVIKGTGEEWMYYFEDAAYDETAVYGSTLTGDTMPDVIRAEYVGSYDAGDEDNLKTGIKIRYDLTALQPGTYVVSLTKNGETLSSSQFEVIEGNQFVLGYYSISWEDNDTLSVYLQTPNAKQGDNNYRVSLTDENGRAVEGLMTTIDKVYSGYMYLMVTGLGRSSAFRKYYVKISHNELGQAVKTDLSTPYFTGNGELKEITKPIGIYNVRKKGRVIGYWFDNAKFPVQITVYRSYNAKEITSVSIERDDLQDGYYYFKRSLYEKLPNPNVLYDIVVKDSSDRISFDNRTTIGCKYAQSDSDWAYSVTATTLYVNDDELSKATVTVTGNKENPSFTSSDENVVTVSASTEDANVGEIKAVGVGKAVISITADGRTEQINVTVDKLSKVEGIAFDRNALTLTEGTQGELLVNVTPADIWDATKAVEITSSNTGVVTVEKKEAPAGSIAKVALTAVSEGTATITAVVNDKGTEYKATAEVTVTKPVKFEGISFEKEKLTLSLGKQDELILNAVPAEAWDGSKEIDVTSSDTSVVSVEQKKGTENEAARILLTAVSEGTATITAVTNDKGTEYKASVEVTVDGSITAEEQEEEIAKVGTLYALTNSTASLSGVKLPEKWTWVSGEKTLAADEEVQYFSAKFTREDGKSFTAQLPVAVATLAGIKAETAGTGFINPGKSITYTLAYSFEGYQEIPGEALASLCTIQWNLSKGTCVIADATDKNTITLTAKEAGMQEITVTVKAGSVSFTDKVTVTVAAKESVNEIEVTPQAAAKNGVAFVFENDEISVNVKDFKAGEADSILLSAKAFMDEKEVATGVEWTSSDEGVATVTTADDITTLTIKKAGTAVISATASDDGKYSRSIKVSVKDYEPILDNTKIMLNKNLESVELPLFEQNGNHITGIEVYEGDNKSSNYEGAVDGCTFTLKLRADSALRNSTKSAKTPVTLKLSTEKGTYEKAAEISLDVKKISVKFRQTKKPNLFYTDSEAVFEMTSTYRIASVEETLAADAPGFHFSAFDSKSNTLTFKTQGITKENYNSYKNPTVNLKVTFSDFAGSITVPVKIQTENRKPNLAINNVTIYNATQTDLTTSIADKKTREKYALSTADNTITFEPKLDKDGNGVTGVSISEDGRLRLTMKGTKNASYKLTLNDSRWTQPLTLSGKVASAKQPVLALGTNKVTLNMAHSIEDNGYYRIPLWIKDGDMQVKDVTHEISGNKEGVARLKTALQVVFNSDSQQLEIGLNKAELKTLKKGNYKITVKANAEGIGEAKSASFTLTIADKAASVKLSAKGSINMADRAGTSIIYTPKLSDVSAAVDRVRLTGDNADAFVAAVTDDGKIEVKAAPGISLRTKTGYGLGMVLTLDNGSEVTANVTIKLTNKLPKVTATVTKGTLYKVSDRVISTNLTITQKTGQNFAIDRVRIAEDKNSKYFKVTYSSDGKVRISLSDKASEMKAGKYTVKYNVFFKDAAENEKPITVKMAVTVK